MNHPAHREATVYALVVGMIIARLRERRGMTQLDLAKAMETTQSSLSRIERGEAQPDAFQLRRAAEALGKSHSELNELIEDAYVRTAEAARHTIPQQRSSTRKSETPWWQVALAAAGVVGVAGLVAFAVSVALDDSPDKPSKK